jgi:hypothetical protein
VVLQIGSGFIAVGWFSLLLLQTFQYRSCCILYGIGMVFYRPYRWTIDLADGNNRGRAVATMYISSRQVGLGTGINPRGFTETTLTGYLRILLAAFCRRSVDLSNRISA